ncbi:kinase [Thraustotheca clavata]|uniref:Kinase n=1 Tax=Thraustotheca clavata TaxID=74557 RepID=A0A1W0A0N2_9STRA|nr:kinase [Thraustotheca clavata]
MGCTSSKESHGHTDSAPTRPIVQPVVAGQKVNNGQPGYVPPNVASNRGNKGPELPVGGGSAPAGMSWNKYEALEPLKDTYWINPDDVTRIRSVNSNYMKTEMGNLNGHPVLIKSFDLSKSEEEINKTRKMLISEITSMTRISHPNIVKFLGFNITSEYGLCCITEYMDGKTLRHLLDNPRQASKLTWAKEKISIAIDIASALAYMHSLKPVLIHRNVKAAKILLTSKKTAKLSGFGAARDRTFEYEMTTGVGDMQWSAPELLLDGEDYTEQVDVYSFGVVLTELDTGSVPFMDEMATMTKAEITMKLVTGSLRPKLSPECPEVIVRIVKQCLQQDPLLRPRKVPPQPRPSTSHGPSASSAPKYVDDWDYYTELEHLKEKYWIEPENVIRVRSIPCNYMKTDLGNVNGQPVLIKCLDLTKSEEDINKSRKMLMSEITSMTRIDHPNVVKFLGFNFTPEYGLCCMTEFMEGKTLRHLLDNPHAAAKLTWPKEKISIAIDIISALAYMHSLKPVLIHRNVKASKILLSNKKIAKLSGFGIARDRTFEMEMTTGVGDMQWSAPELLLDGEDYTEQVDVYSFGVVLTELDTGAVPFVEEMATMNKAELTMKLITGTLRPQLSPDCPACIVKIVKQCLQQDPHLRPRSDKMGGCFNKPPPPPENQNYDAPVVYTVTPPPTPPHSPLLDWSLYTQLEPFKDTFWIDPDEIVHIRTIPSHYMKTEVGSYIGEPVLLKSFDQMNLNEADIAARKKLLMSEIVSMVQIHHPNIVAFLGFNITKEYGLTCISEYIDGNTLRHLLDLPKTSSKLTWANEKIGIAIDIASALAYMHALKPVVIHRNVKASKILLTGDRTTAKLSGFGVARTRTYEAEMTARVGDVPWAAPELVLEGGDYTEQVDVYAFGIVLTELDTSAVPFAAEIAELGVAEVTVQLVTGVLRPRVSPNCPKCIVKIIKQCLQLDSHLRPPSEVIVDMLLEAKKELLTHPTPPDNENISTSPKALSP